MSIILGVKLVPVHTNILTRTHYSILGLFGIFYLVLNDHLLVLQIQAYTTNSFHDAIWKTYLLCKQFTYITT